MTLSNRLAEESSPYLLQHADNPVHWQPWDERALAAARELDRPILLSIGYSSCHWCHVMAHESFADADTARLMNAHFVNIKVDREERPDLDKLYQTAHALMTQRNGGWPLTMFLEPETLAPFYGGTYFPKTARAGLPAFAEILERVAEYFRTHRDEIRATAGDIRQTFARLYHEGRPAETLHAAPLDMLRHEAASLFDPVHGGFGAAPRFPQPTLLERLLRHWHATRGEGQADAQALHMVRHSLERMSNGGVFDQLGGGFFRYSTDERWEIPHFEKMLYDNAQLIGLLAELRAATGSAIARHAASLAIDWALRDMQTPEGAFLSAVDADSEGEEGRFYTWTPEEVETALGADFPVFAARWGLDGPANFEGRWHLHGQLDTTALAERFGMQPRAVRALLKRARLKLLPVREQRPRPGLDDKVLTAWNALMITGLLRAARHLDRPQLRDEADRCLQFLRRELWVNGRLMASWKNGEARHPAYLDDHAFLLQALLERLQQGWDAELLEWAVQLTERLLGHFQAAGGGFFFTADDHEQLLERPRSFNDEALPNGNAIAARALMQLGWLLSEPRYLDAAEATLKAGFDTLQNSPLAHAGMAT
ncbi:MAG: thioredoxin domain-containing protein, partial [Gammaproteobacteria bacterium]